MILRGFQRLAVSVAVAVAVLACGSGGGGGGPVEQTVAVMELDPAEIQFNYGSVDVGDAKAEIVSIINTGNKNLDIASIRLEYAPKNPELETGPDTYAISVQFNEGEQPPRSVAPKGEGTAEIADVYYFKVQVTNLGDDLDREATIVIESNDEDTPTFRLPVTARSGVPRIRVTPTMVEFGRVGANDTLTKGVIVRNQGAADLVLTGFVFTGDDVFTFQLGELSVTPSAETQAGVDFAAPVVVPADGTADLSFTFAPLSDDAASAKLVLFSNDPDAGETGTLIELRGNQELPCIKVEPSQVDFGAVLPGNQQALPVEICSCGTTPLTVTGIAITDDQTGGAYSADLSPLFDPGAEVLLDVDHPLVLNGNECATFNVLYAPSQLSPTGPDGAAIPDQATLVVTNDSFYASLQVAVRGVATEVVCPTAHISVEEGDQVIPQTVLHLHGDQSFSPNGSITSYQWTVTQPQGSVSNLIPSPTFPNPIFEANIAGKYVFTLEVIDSTGIKSCYAAQQEVYVVPDEAIHIELLWDTPGDPDPGDEGPAAGTDMDLHFAHPYASGPDIDGDGAPDPWFNDPYDVFWFDKNPDWGSFDPSIDDDPGLDRDDTDGGGPENVNLNIPEGDTALPYTYRVAVHYWDDKNFGESYATVRVYIYSTLAFEVGDVKMYASDLWEVCTVEWPSTKITLTLDSTGGYKITPNYKNPLFSPN